MKTTFMFLLIALAFSANCQTEALNKLDDKGKKHGKWVVYWDNNWKQVDSAKGVYARYTFYDHGDNLNAMGPCGSKNLKLESAAKSENKIGNAKLLDGEYKWNDNKGKLRFLFVIKHGEFVSYKEYNNEGTLVSFFDYTQEYNNQPHSYKVFQYNKKGELKWEGYMTKDMNGNRYVSRPK